MNRITFVQHHRRQFQRLPLNLGPIQVSEIYKSIRSQNLNYNLPFILTMYFDQISNAGSLRSPRQRRQRTTSINLNKTIDATESIIRANNRTIYTAGRPPWYNCAGQQVEPFVIGWFSFCLIQKQAIF